MVDTPQSQVQSDGALISPSRWSGRIFTGSWVEPGGGRLEDIEPATGEPLAEVGVANAEDVARSCARAAAVQPAWAARNHEERAQTMLVAAALIRQHHDELREWIMRECGGVRAKAQMELHDAEQRLLHSAAMAYQPLGHVLPTAMPGHRSFAQRVPVGVVGVISPFNFPLVLSIRSWRRLWCWATPSCSSQTRARRSPEGS